MGRHLWAAAVLGLFWSAAAQAQVMTLPGALEVSETGAAVYTVPIEVPPGTAGMQPALELQYNSQGGNGLLGVGWSLSGLPSIGRCPRTLAQDGVRGGVNYDANDRFCLDGQRLVAITGTYGADGTEYRLEREGFSKIVPYGTAGTGPAWFKVWTKAGQVMELGNTADSRIEAQGKTTARLWAVNKVSDTVGNYLTVGYAEDSTNGEYRPSRVDYTGNTAGSVSPYASVQFVYEVRPDIVPLYQAGSLIKTTQRLIKVQTYTGSTLVRDYRLAYSTSPANGRSRIANLTRCDASGSCLPATSFQWVDSVNGFGPSQQAIADFGANSWDDYTRPRFVVDANGDGKDDIVGFASHYVVVSLSNGTGFNSQANWHYGFGTYDGWANTNTYPRHVIDVNGDGLPDVVAFAENGVGIALNTGSSFGSKTVCCADFGSNAGWVNNTSHPRHMADVNGDGLPDIVGFSSTGVWVGLNTGSSFAAAQQWSTSYGGWDDNTRPRVLADVNGDGRDDIVGFDSLYVTVSLSTGTSFSTPAHWYTGYGTSDGWTNMSILPRYMTDANGDGLADVVAFAEDWVVVSLSTGSTFGPRLLWHYGFGTYDGWANTNVFPRHLVDVNGDGLPDVEGFAENGIGIAPNTGTSFGTKTICCADFGSNAGWTDNTSRPRYFADVNGDGKPDIVGFGATATYVGLSGNSPPSDLLASIADGLGAATALTYKPLTDNSIYTKGTGEVFPVLDLQVAFYVVSAIESSDGLGGTYQSTYRYAGAKADLSGRGFLGFREMTVRDEETGIEQVTTYRQDWPYVGQIASRVKTLDVAGVGLVELNRVDNTYAATDLGGLRRFVHLTQSVETSRELDGTALPVVTTTYQYDAYGNTTEVVTSTPDGYSKTTANTYTNDITNWLLGRLTRAEVTSVTPN